MRAFAAAFATLALVAGVPTFATAQAAAGAQTCSGDVPLAATVERVSYKSRGRDIQALLFRPTGPANGAGVVVLHGSGGLPRDLPRFESQVGQWASQGYHVLLPDYYDASRQDPRTNPLVFDRWEEANDAGLQYLAQVNGVSAEHIGLWGFSLGGTLALDSVLDGGLAKAAVVVGSSGRPGRGAPQTPILMLVGDHDPDVSPAGVKETERLLRERGVPISVDTYTADRHLLEPGEWCEVFTKSRTFLDAQLLATAR